DCPIVPISLAGFGRRYKDGPLVAQVGQPVRMPKELGRNTEALQNWIERFREDISSRVKEASSVAYGPPHFQTLT
ncbi:MAG: hypothetical protein QNJ05_16590, partial [Woeseiaceae bacterium]|nr:hypothetical protein [Woeseiaceae bacterium]